MILIRSRLMRSGRELRPHLIAECTWSGWPSKKWLFLKRLTSLSRRVVQSWMSYRAEIIITWIVDKFNIKFRTSDVCLAKAENEYGMNCWQTQHHVLHKNTSARRQKGHNLIKTHQCHFVPWVDYLVITIATVCVHLSGDRNDIYADSSAWRQECAK